MYAHACVCQKKAVTLRPLLKRALKKPLEKSRNLETT